MSTPSSTGEVIVRKIEEPTIEVVRQVMDVGQSAWLSTLKDRSAVDIGYLYDSKDPNAVTRQQKAMEALGKSGVYLAAYDASSNEMIAYVAATPDVSGSAPARFVKSRILKREPYAKVAILNVRGDSQHAGLGTALTREVLQEPIFAETQRPTAYVLDENLIGRRFWVGRIAMSITPEDQPATPLENYFGPDSRIAHHWRYEGPPIGSVVEFINVQQQRGVQVADFTRV